jgi:hypothetical protein
MRNRGYPGPMIAATDTLSLAPGVALEDGRLSDDVGGGSWPLNPSGRFVLARTGVPVGRIVRELADAYSLSNAAARADVLRFVWHLNALTLVNVDGAGSPLRRFADWFLLAARLAPSGAIPAVTTRRRSLDTRSVARAIGSSLGAIRARMALIAAATMAVAAQPSALAGASGLVIPLGLGVGAGLGIGFHEAAHAALLRGVPSALVTRGHRTYVLHARVSPTRRSLVALAGPLAVAGLGVGLVVAGSIVVAPAIAITGCPLVAHALALTVAGGDGRVACGL